MSERLAGWLAGRPDRVALAFGGEDVTVAELRRRVDATQLPPGSGAIGCPADADPVAIVATVLAALERGRAVVVGGTQRDADRVTARLPSGTELALTTSGSSGAGATPRVVARTNSSWLASAEPLAEVCGLGGDERIAVTGPLHVSMHLYAVLHALWLGATATDRVRDADLMHATPTRLARALDGDCPPAVVVAGAALGAVTRARAVERGIRLTEYYGAAELSFVLAGRPTGADADGLAPFPGVEIELRGPASEVWARSPYLALGVIGGGMLRRDDAGFATVGDLAAQPIPGTFRVLGRGEAAITTAGATVIAEEVEAVLDALPGVVGAAVIGEADELLGERIVAVVELEEGAALEPVVAAARERLSTAQLPRRWHVAPLPRTASGKVARGVLRETSVAGGLGPGHPVAVPARSAP